MLLGLRSVLVNLGEACRSSDRLREAGVFADKLNDDRRRAHVWALSAADGALRGHLDEGITVGWRALAISERLDDGALGLMARGSRTATWGSARSTTAWVSKNVRTSI
jgi:hypothetical protein